jgi:4-hydroxybenzoate polyprenyltransferase
VVSQESTQREGPAVLEETPTPLSRFQGLVRATRPGQWYKNTVCFAGLFFSGQLVHPRAILLSWLAFVGFCFGASGIYLWNDVLDRSFDQLNPKKRTRPIASGLVPVSWALATSAVLMTVALASSLVLGSLCVAVLVCYLVMQIAYSVRLKHTVLLDVMIIALGFVLRVLYGVYAIEVKPTAWIVLCMFFLALHLGFAKRRGELHLIGESEPHRRPVLGKYRVGYLDMLLAMTATMAILCYALYTVTGWQNNVSLVLTVPLVAYGIMRYMLLVMVHGEGDAPERLLVSDPILIAIVITWVLLCVGIIYGDVHIFLE